MDSSKGKVPSIGDYAIIGDCQSAALISRRGELDWLCWPRFDSPSVFAGILDPQRGGRWVIMPAGEFRSSRHYLPNTNVLQTRFETKTGVVTLTDFMPVNDKAYRKTHLAADHAIVRLLRCESGTVETDIRFSPRPNYGQHRVRIVPRGKLGLRINSGHGMIALHSDVAFDIADGVAQATVSMKSGDELPLILTYAQTSPEVMPLLNDAAASLARTAAWWRQWVSSNRYKGPYIDVVVRSILTLKLLEFPASGAFVAAPTTSLPEKVGGKLNWDYRYCWLRDASFILEALCGTGFTAEAEAFAEWLLHATRRTQPKLLVMYNVYGNLAPPEREMPHLAGHRGSSPLNIGNGARDQSQLDTYGEVLSGAATLLKHKNMPADRETSKVLIEFGNYVVKHWREPDAGIWEDRTKPVAHTHSRLLCWKALDALIDLHNHQLIRKAPLGLFSQARDAIRQCIESESWDESALTYTSQPGTLKLDATLLQLAIHGFDDPTSLRMRQTSDRVCRDLGAGGPLLYRNLPEDGIPKEGAFGICGFWRAQLLAMGGGSLIEAQAAFESLLKTGNDVGLFGEETDPATGDALGNFPQAFTHVGLINAALSIEKRRQEEAGGR